MKFTDGYWNVRDHIKPLYAVEFSSATMKGDELIIYVASKEIITRGDTLNTGLLTIKISSPLEGVFRILMSHFEGTENKGPKVKIEKFDSRIRIVEDQDSIEYISGSAKVMIDKRPNSWGMRFYDDGDELSNTGFRNMAYMCDSILSKNYMVEQLSLDIGEYVYGLGEQFTPFVKNGQTVEMWNEDGGTASDIAYKNIPFYVSDKGYGVLVAHEEDVAYEIASEKVERVQFSVEGEWLEYYFICGGTPKGTIEKYTKLTGRPALPPAWSFGLWLSTSFTTNYDEETASVFIDGMAKRGIPLSVFHFDCFWMEAYEWCNFKWDSQTFPEPREMLQRYHDKGLKICVWINPYIGQKSELFSEGMEQGFLLKKKNGDVWQTDTWQAGLALVDFTNPDAVKWYKGKLKNLLDMGVDSFKTDFGEKIPVKDIAYYDGSDAVKMHNYYTHLYNKAVFELLEEERGKGEAVVFARSATVGGQIFPVHWGGDCSASYASMAETLRGGLSLALSGFGFWSHDISGFENTASADVYKRWSQFGLLSSHSRLHGSSSYRVPWEFDDEACKVVEKFAKLKCKLMPYLYYQAVIAHENGTPMLRPMFLEFPQDRTCATLDCQYMLGESLLVAPIFKESGDVEYYLPKGKWTNLLNRQIIEGGMWIKENHDYFSMPLLVKENSLLVIGACSSKPDYNYCKDFTIFVSNFVDGATETTWITNLVGERIVEIEACCKGNIVWLEVKGLPKDNKWNYESLGDQEIEIV